MNKIQLFNSIFFEDELSMFYPIEIYRKLFNSPDDNDLRNLKGVDIIPVFEHE